MADLIGRTKDIAEIKEKLKTAKLLTLTGYPGCGKTVLADEVVRVAGAVLQRVWKVELGSLKDSTKVVQQVADVLRVRQTVGGTLEEALLAELKPYPALLLLDNCEHLLNPCRRLVDWLLRHCPDLRILATSRELLGLSDAEHEWRVQLAPGASRNEWTGGARPGAGGSSEV